MQLVSSSYDLLNSFNLQIHLQYEFIHKQTVIYEFI